MWNRKELKANARKSFTPVYWKSVIAAAIFTFFTYSSMSEKHEGPNGESLLELISSWQIAAIVTSILGVGLVLAILFKVFIINPMKIGYAQFRLDTAEKEPKEVSIKTLFSRFFKGQYASSLWAIFTTDVICMLWALLFVIPGIIKAYEYRFVDYILAEQPFLSGKEARAMSREMMKGQKWDAFVLDLSFIGWAFLSALTAGILSIFWVKPYYYMTDCYLYKALKKD